MDNFSTLCRDLMRGHRVSIKQLEPFCLYQTHLF